MRTCWAASLGDCSDKISSEHIITDGTFLADAVKVKGLPWCLDGFKMVGLATLVKNVLCTDHNSRLSGADIGAIQLRKTLCEIADLSESRKRMRSQGWPIRRFSVNGLALERWCLKTLITIAFNGKIPIGCGDSPPGQPPPVLVETAFGLRRFPPRAGLYWMGDGGDEIKVSDGVVVTTFSGPLNRIEGARFWFWGLDLLLMLSDWPAGQFSFTSVDGKQTISPKTWHHPAALNFSVHSRPSHVLHFAW